MLSSPVYAESHPRPPVSHPRRASISFCFSQTSNLSTCKHANNVQAFSESSPHSPLLSCQQTAPVNPLAATPTEPPATVADKRLTENLTPLNATLTKNRGEGPPPLGSTFRTSTFLRSGQSPTDVSFCPMNILLSEVECRVLGSLIEKEITTPEYYPLSLNALINACNQKSNREPVMTLDEAAVRQTLHTLDGQSLLRSVSALDSRVTKYEHRLQEAFNFYRHEIAILCVLLLRGPQTPGELRIRTERMHDFDDLSAVHSSLNHLMKREPPLAKVLPRQPGTKESRYAHLLSGDVEFFETK